MPIDAVSQDRRGKLFYLIKINLENCRCQSIPSSVHVPQANLTLELAMLGSGMPTGVGQNLGKRTRPGSTATIPTTARQGFAHPCITGGSGI